MPPKNDPGYGTEYEILVPALFSLQFLLNTQIEDFNIEINAENFGNLDDLKIHLKYTNGKEENYAIQLKHKESQRNIQPGNFEADRGDFSIQKYCQGYRDIEAADKTKFHYILFTNQNFDKSNIGKVTKFRMETFMDCPGNRIFNTDIKDNIFKFDANSETSDLNKEFFSRFSVYVSQKNFKGVEDAILKDIFEIQLRSNRDTALRFIHFIRNAHNSIFTDKILHRDTLKYHFLDLLVSPLIFELDSLEEHNETTFLFENAINQFDISLIQNPDEVLLKENWKSRNYNIVDEKHLIRWAQDHKFITKADVVNRDNVDKIKNIFLYCIKSKPLILSYNKNTKSCIDFVLSLFNNSLKLVLFVDDPMQFEFDNKQIFRSLLDLKKMQLEIYKKLTEELKITIQGRETSLRNFISANEEVEELFSLQDLIYCMNGLKIGLSDEELPTIYIARHVVTKVLINIQTASDNNPNDLFVISCKERCKKSITLDEYLDKYQKSEKINTNIVSTDNIDMDEIKQRVDIKNIHFLIYLTVKNENYFQLISSSCSDHLKNLLQDLHIDEREIYKHFNKTGLEIISATPGMGKSTMMTYLKKTCPLDYWIVKINLRDYNYLFEKPRTAEEILDNLHEENAEKFEKYYFKKGRILWLFDGVDELSFDRINNVIKTVFKLRKLKHKVWLSTRQNFKRLLTDTFFINPIEIQEVSLEEQEIYIAKRLSLKYSHQEITGICDKIFCNIHIINNRKILGVPLQLFIITQTFLDYDVDEIKNDIFLLTNMYKHFFEGQFRHLLKKMKIKNQHFVEEDFDEKLETYEIPALKACLSEAIFNNLKITLTEKKIKKFENHGDQLGIIVNVSRFGAEVFFTFFHQTYAEYFAAFWLSQNFENIDDKNFLFDPKYQNLKYFFDMILCEKCPAHLAILYKNLDLLRKCHESEITMVDSAGRSVLHLVFSSGESFPCYEIKMRNGMYEINTKSQDYVANQQYKKLLECFSCIQKIPFLVRDRLMQKNALEYADELFSISSLAYVANSTKLDLDLLQNCKNKTLLIFYYAMKFGYKSLLLHANPIYQNLAELLSRNIIVVAILRTTFLHTAISNKQSEIIKFLAQQNLLLTIINVADSEQRTPLHLSVIGKQFEIFKTLLLSAHVEINTQDIYKMSPFFTALNDSQREFLDILLVHKNIDVNLIGYNGVSSLHLAVMRGNLETLKKLLEVFKMDVNKSDDLAKTALCYAINRSNLEAVKILLKFKADVDFQDKNGDSSLHCALKLEFNTALLEIVKELLKHKPDLDLKNNHDETPLTLALQNNYKMLTQVVQINEVIDVNYQDSNGNSFLIKSVKSGSLEETEDLLRHQELDVNLKDNNGATALHWASLNCFYSGDVKSLEIFKSLLKRRDLEINSRDLEERSALHWITGNISDSIVITRKFDNVDLPVEVISSCIRALREKGIHVNSRDVRQKTPLLLASELLYPEVVGEILKVGGSVDAVDFEENSALHLAVSSDFRKVTKIRWITDGVLESNRCRTTRVLLQNNSNPNVKNINKQTPLHLASELNNNTVQELLNSGVKINEVDENGRTALHLAVFNIRCVFSPENHGTVALLLEQGSDINAVDNSGKTALHTASYLNNSKDIPTLLEYGANVNLQDNEGNTPLHLAVCSEWIKVAKETGYELDKLNKIDRNLESYFEIHRLCTVKMLLDQSINVGIPNNEGKTALELAETSRRHKIIDLLRKK